ncbi:MAG: xanthine dehydrogenase family protein molybdopterin-binding subunit [Burkholderiales bacterium]
MSSSRTLRMPNAARWIGAPIVRKEDEAILTGRARYIDDLEPVAQLCHAAIVRSPHPHARIRGIDSSRAKALPGVIAVVTGKELLAIVGSIPSVVRTPARFYPFAHDKARYVGEPLAVVVARDRYIAEDAAELVEVDYESLQGVSDLEDAIAPGAPRLFDDATSNVLSSRTFRYGDPDRAFENADRVFRLDYRFPRSFATPMETYGVIAQFERAPDRFTVWSNFQGPYVLQPLMAGALRVPGNRLRLITPQASGGSFGVKQAVFPYIVLLCAVSRLAGVPVKWTEDRLEHLMASSSASDRLGTVEAAFSNDGVLQALRYVNHVNLGAYIRAPEPASIYRMHAASNGAYRVRNLAIDNHLVVSNRVPCGLNRGYGGPQFYFALERIMEIAARGLKIDPSELRRRNLVERNQFPYKGPAGATYDTGDFGAVLQAALERADYPLLVARRDAARLEGRLFGIGLAVGVEPSGSNMAYVSLAQTPAERAKGDPKSGANATATVSIDPTGQVTVTIASTPNGQGHATVAAQIVADQLGLDPKDIDVNTELDTRGASWSIASGNYANRFSSIVADALVQSATKVADKIKRIAAEDLEVNVGDIELADGVARVVGVPAKAIPLRKLALRTHWHTRSLPGDMEPGIFETATLSPPSLDAISVDDQVGSALTYGFVCDLVAVEIDKASGRIDFVKYVSVHDVGNMLNPLIVEGQIHGGFAHGLGAALMEELQYDRDGNFLSGTLAEYLCPTAPSLPPLDIGHVSVPSDANLLGAKGMGDGSSMLAPAAVANAVADALGRDDIELPLTFDRVWRYANEGTNKDRPS